MKKKKVQEVSYVKYLFGFTLVLFIFVGTWVWKFYQTSVSSQSNILLVSSLINPPDKIFFQGITGTHSLRTFRSLHLDELNSSGNQIPSFFLGRYQSWSQDELAKADFVFLEQVHKAGAIPYISWEPWSGSRLATPSSQIAYRLANIVRGDFDSYIHTYASDLKKFGYPVLLRFAHEMNGDWYPWGIDVNSNTSKDFVDAWRHVHDIFISEGAINVLWLWAPNEPFGGKNGTNSAKYSTFYPGDSYVDWVGFSAYNWGEAREFNVNRSFSTMVSKAYDLLVPFRKPIMLAESNSSITGVDKADWIKNMKADLKKFPLIRGAIWYESDDGSFSIEKELFLVPFVP